MIIASEWEILSYIYFDKGKIGLATWRFGLCSTKEFCFPKISDDTARLAVFDGI